MLLSIAIDESDAFHTPLEFSALGEASIQLSDQNFVLDGAARLRCSLRDEETNTLLASVAVAPPTADSNDDSEVWLVMPGARGHDRVSLAVDVPGFTLCFDAAAATSSSRNTILRAVRLVRQRAAAAATEEGACAPAADDGASGSFFSSSSEDAVDILDAAELTAIPTVKRSTHGEMLRGAKRPFPHVRCWLPTTTSDQNEDRVAALRRAACALVRTHGLGGRTFWVAADEEPRCFLERFALEVLHFHQQKEEEGDSDNGGGACFTGAEWWVQMRSCNGEEDGSSIAFHFDCDEGLFSATGAQGQASSKQASSQASSQAAKQPSSQASKQQAASSSSQASASSQASSSSKQQRQAAAADPPACGHCVCVCVCVCVQVSWCRRGCRQSPI